MVRRRPDSRLAELVESAARVFTVRGYRRTQMADVAAAMGVAPGTLYLYVESKEALFHFLVERGWTDELVAPELPIRTQPAAATLGLLRDRLATAMRLPRLEAALRGPVPRDATAELAGIVRELYDMVARYRVGIRLLERSALDWPELAGILYGDARASLFAALEAYLRTRIEAGRFRAVPDVAGMARLVNESVAWFAMHRYADPHSAGLDDRLAEETVVHTLVSALAKSPPRAAATSERLTRKRRPTR